MASLFPYKKYKSFINTSPQIFLLIKFCKPPKSQLTLIKRNFCYIIEPYLRIPECFTEYDPDLDQVLIFLNAAFYA